MIVPFNIARTQLQINNILNQNSLVIGIPFQLLSFYNSRLILKSSFYLLGNVNIKQNIIENNWLNTNLESTNIYNSTLKGKFSGTSFQFIWNNVISQNTESFFTFENINFISQIDKINTVILQNSPINSFITYANKLFYIPFTFYENNYYLIKEKYFLVSFGFINKF